MTTGGGHPDDGGREEPTGGPLDARTLGKLADVPALPSEALAGQGVAAFLVRPTDLDHLPVLTEVPDTVSAQARRTLTPDDYDDAASLILGKGRQPAELPQERRWRPTGGTWPQEGITLTYGELRRLIALHLAQCAHTMPRHQPWLFADAAAKAMADGETPLRLAEVME